MLALEWLEPHTAPSRRLYRRARGIASTSSRLVLAARILSATIRTSGYRCLLAQLPDDDFQVPGEAARGLFQRAPAS